MNRVWWLWLVPSMLLLGCGGVQESARNTPGRTEPQVKDSGDQDQRRALEHFVDGSIYETKGDYARAILEYQDALRFDKDPAIYFALSKNFAILGKNALAIDAAKEALRRAPGEMTYRRNLADIYAGAFELDAAAEQFEEIIKRDSSQVDAWYNLARIYQVRKPLRSLEVFEQILQRFGPDWDVLLQTAEIYSKMGKFDKSAEALRQMGTIDPGNRALQENLAQAYVRAGKFDEALAVYAGLRERHPEDLGLRAEVAGVYLAQGAYPRAAEEFDAILSQDTVSVEVKLHIGEMYFGQMGKDSTLAPLTRTIFERIAAQHPADWRAYWFLGAVGTLMRDDSLAVQSFKKVTELASWNADAWVYLSSVFLGKNNFAEVARVLETALKVLPDDFRVNFFLGVSYSRLGRNLDAVRVLEKARQLNPRDVDVIAQLALVYDSMKKFEESDALYEEAIRIDGANHLVLNNYAYSLAERNAQLERALTYARKAVETQPDNPSYLDTIGWIYFRLGQYTEAEQYVKQAISKGEVSAVVYEHLGDIYYKMNQKDLAMEHWQMALKLDEANAPLRDKIARGSL
jgi:tetratricopeptide (TPR) repeat protein